MTYVWLFAKNRRLKCKICVQLKEKVESLSQHIENLNEKHKKSEQEKEHWKVEYQLVQMKHDNMKDKLEGLFRIISRFT